MNPRRPAGPSTPRRDLVNLGAGVLCLSLLLTLSGAFDTDDLGFLHRWTLWLIFGGLVVGQAAYLDRTLARMAPEGPLFRCLAAFGAVALTVVLMTFELHALKFTPLLPKEPDPLWPFLWFVAPPVSAIAGFVVLLRSPLARRTLQIDALSDRVGGMLEISARPIIAGLLPPPTAAASDLSAWPHAPVLYVQALDHYLEIVTRGGRSLVRGRMRDALARLAGEDGLQVHRSWWVSRGAVAQVQRSGRDYVVVLSDGAELPVARSRVQAMRHSGWV